MLCVASWLTFATRSSAQDMHRITLRGNDDLKIALRQYDKSGLPYLKLVLERGNEQKKRSLFTGFARGATKSKAASVAGSEAGGSEAGAGSSQQRKG